MCYFYPLLTCSADASAPLRLDNPDFDHINNIFDKLGHIPRLCINYNEKDLWVSLYGVIKTHYQQIEDPVGMATRSLNAISHKIYLVRRLNPTDLDYSFKIEVLPVTAIIGSRIALQLRNAKRCEQILPHKQLTALPLAKKLSCNLFDAYCRQRFSERIWIEFVPMVRLGGLKVSGKMSKNKCWYLPQCHTSNTKLATSFWLQ